MDNGEINLIVVDPQTMQVAIQFMNGKTETYTLPMGVPFMIQRTPPEVREEAARKGNVDYDRTFVVSVATNAFLPNEKPKLIVN